MSTRDEIIEQVLALSPEDRAIVLDVLEQSLPHEGSASDEVAAAWSKEIERRLERYMRGEVRALEHDEAFEFLRRSLAEQPAERADS